MATICNLKSQYLKRDYTLISMAHGFASVELRNPIASENCAVFEVAADEVINVRQVESYVMPVGYDLYTLEEYERRDEDARCDRMAENDMRHGG